MLGLLIMILMAIIIGAIGNTIAGDRMPGGVFGSMIAGFAGAWLGTLLFGTWGPVIGKLPFIPAIIGAALFVFIIGLISRMFRKAV